MAAAIRLTRIGGKNDPCYRVVVAHKRGPRDGNFVEQIGTYDPRKKEQNAVLNLTRVDHWLRCGAQPTETVASLIRRARRELKAQEAAAAPATEAKPA